MTSIGAAMLPFFASLPAGYGIAAATASGQEAGRAQSASSASSAKAGATSGSVTAPRDVLDVRVPLPGGTFTTEAGDSLGLRDLFDAGDNAYDTIARYRVALRDDPSTPGGGRLMLRGEDVTDRIDFTPAEFNELQFVAGPDGARTDLVVVARQGKSDGKGGLIGIVDSPAVQITASTTGTRSINAAAALRTPPEPGDGDAAFLRVAQGSALFNGLGGTTTRPSLSTAGNFTAEAGDSLGLRDLFDAGDNAYDTVALYRVALRDDPDSPGGGRLMLRGEDVTSRIDFTPAEFNELQFVAGPNGAGTDLVVVARQGKSDGKGGLTGIVDSPAVQITASTTGTRSINAAAALRTPPEPGDGDAAFLRVAQGSALFNGLGGTTTRPSLSTAGNFTAEAGDSLGLRDLFDAGDNAYDTVALYRVALRDDPDSPGGGRLMLRGEDVTSRIDFTPAEFNELQFVAGPNGAGTDLVVVARQGKSDGKGGLTGIVDSPAVQITASTTGTRSINAAAALRTPPEPGDNDTAFLRVTQGSALFSGLGSTTARPSLSTVGNFTAEAGDSLGLRDLFDAGTNAYDTIALYRVALRDDPSSPAGGRLMLRGEDVTSRIDFTPAEFNELQFVAGPDGARTDLVVVARQGKSDGKGGLTGIVDSPAVQITASVTSTRSINAVAALRTPPEPGDGDAAFLRVVQGSALFSGLGSTTTRPSLSTVGNFTAEAGDSLGLRDLFDAGDNAYDTIALYRVALRDDPSTPGGGRLMLRGEDVTNRIDFTPDEFNELQFIAGPDGARTDLVVVARQGKSDGKGGLTGIVDSPAVQITASTTGTRSINAAAALRTPPEPGDSDAAFLRVAQGSALFSGLGNTTTRPSLSTVIPGDDPALSPERLAGLLRTFQALGWSGTGAQDPALLYAGAVGGSRSNAAPATAASSRGAIALALLLGNDIGGVQVAADGQGQTLMALQAYRRLAG
ncbi:MAG: hypothetical protein AAGC69_08970 [Paracraurococcus sp.]